MSALFPLASRVPSSNAPRAPLLAALLLLTLLPLPAAASAAPAGGLPPLGIDMGSVPAVEASGIDVRYGSYWVGSWMASSGWGGLTSALDKAVATGTTPVVYWYYWGDSISPSCIDHGCGGKSQAQWTSMTATLADHLRTRMGGREVLVVLENEFNKGGVTGSYAPTLDAKLEAVAKTLKGVPGVKIVLGFGNWGESEWTKFPKAAGQSDYIGFQMMRAQTRDSEASYRGATDRTTQLTQHVAAKFGKPAFLYDLALSSYPSGHWERVQAETLDAIFKSLATSGSTGLHGVVYRSLKDTWMDPSNYYGAAESHWGLQRMDGSAKPAWSVFHAHATAAPPPPNVPGEHEAEAMSATAGGRQNDAAASGGALWNLWSNGELRHTLVAEAAATMRIEVVARGTLAAGVAPRMTIRLGEATLGAFDVPPGFATYTVDAPLPAGASTLRLVYANDAVVGAEDRNLLLDVVRVKPTPPAVDTPPVASFTATAAGLRVELDASASSDPEARPLAYRWSLGDGTTAEGRTWTHTYAHEGAYEVVLTVDDGVHTTSASRNLTLVRPQTPPVASFTVAQAGAELVLDASGSSDADGDALGFAWSLGDGATASGPVVKHAYARAGTYEARLTVTDDRGAAANATRTIVVAPFAATFRDLSGNEWWVQVYVDGDRPIASVCAQVDGGACQPLQLRSWGAWAASFHVPRGADIIFRATSAGGEAVASEAYDWPSGKLALRATFQPHGGNAWWVQTKVDANAPIQAVCASVNGGACQPLSYRSWGSWAASFHAPAGAKVVFVATGTDGQAVRSGAYPWPIK